jgi:TRAP-type transport system large permease protein
MVAFLFLVFLAFMLMGMEVFFSMSMSSYLGILVKSSRQVDTSIIPLRMVAGIDEYTLVAIPLFILTGELMNKGGITRRLVDFSLALVGHVKGGLSQVAVITNVIMAGVSGAAVADASATGTILIPAMKDEGYEPEYAGAVIAAAALIGPVIPPSIPMVIYGVMAHQSIGKLFVGGIIPGLMLGLGFMLTCWIIARKRNYPSRVRLSWHRRLCAIVDASWALCMPLIILGGIRFGIVTVTEAAGVAVVYAMVVGAVVYRELNWQRLMDVLYEAGLTTGVIMILLSAAGIFSWLLAESQVNVVVAEAILGISTDPTLVLLIINGMLLIIGSLLEPMPAMIIFLPALIPIGNQLGIDPIHFGWVCVLNLMIGMLTPPVGLLLFVSSAIGKIPMGPLVREIVPFLILSFIVLAAVTYFPALTVWLPGLM